ncbi:hypothetical protein L7F22_011900 [Adiantum nelumboides]|nr:hypothetical protein [Adiantum nelumboides]
MIRIHRVSTTNPSLLRWFAWPTGYHFASIFLSVSFLATNVAVPGGYPAGGVPPDQGSGPPDLHIDVDPPAEASSPSLNRTRSYGSYSSASSQAYYGSATNSPRSGFYQDSINEIAEVASMPRSASDNNRTTPTSLNVPIDVANLNVIGTPPPGYSAREEPPLKRALREAHRLWIAPMLAGLPTFLDKWWKGIRAAKHQRKKANLRGIDAVVQGIKDNTLALDPQEIFTARAAGAFLLFILAISLVYVWYAQRKRNEHVVFDTDKFDLDPTKRISLVPKKKYILDRANNIKRIEPPQGSPKDTGPAGLFVPYQYPPSRNNYIQRSCKATAVLPFAAVRLRISAAVRFPFVEMAGSWSIKPKADPTTLAKAVLGIKIEAT